MSKIASRFRCTMAKHGHVVVLEPIGPPDGSTGVIVGTGRGPCELGRVSDPSDLAEGVEYEITINRVGVFDGPAGGQT